MIKELIKYHIIPIILSVILVGIYVLFNFQFKKNNQVHRNVLVEGVQKKKSGHYANLNAGNQREIDFISSIKNSEQLTVLGSSELIENPYAPFNYLPNNFGIGVLALGHAYHQELSMLIELLATNDCIEGAKVCIILSPGWFVTEGTNSAAFVEFSRPNFLSKIINDSTINDEYKVHIGKYIDEQQDEIDGLSPDMVRFKDLYTEIEKGIISNSIVKLHSSLKNNAPIVKTNYKVKSNGLERKVFDLELDKLSDSLQTEFISSITTNEMYVTDDYFTKHILKKNGDARKGSVSDVLLNNNNELEDFKILIKYLSEKKVDASFVIQPLNPYYYSGLEKYDPLINIIKSTLDEKGFTYLNMFVNSKEQYSPGVLMDIMHLGDYGWMEVNEFLVKEYYEE